MRIEALLTKSNQGLDLVPISLRELLYFNEAPCELFSLSNGVYKTVLKAYSYVGKSVLKEFIEKGIVRLWVKRSDHTLLIESHQNLLRQNTRSLSIDDPLEKGKKQLGLLTLNMAHLYRDPTNDAALLLQHQSVKNLAAFLYARPEIHVPLYRDYIKQKHHYIYAQPLLSSLFLLGVLKQSPLYSEKEVETLFVTSFFKDIGMSAIPIEKFEAIELSHGDKVLLAKHPEHSVRILKGRIPLGVNHLRIIENHHSFSLLGKDINKRPTTEDSILLSGFETMIVSTMDIISAMIAERPYRAACTLFDALELVKILVADQYPQEFRMMVGYFKNFFIGRGPGAMT